MQTWKITLSNGTVRLLRARSETWAWNKAAVRWRDVLKVEGV